MPAAAAGKPAASRGLRARVLLHAAAGAVAATLLLGLLGSWLAAGMLGSALERMALEENRAVLAQVETELAEVTDFLVRVAQRDGAMLPGAAGGPPPARSRPLDDAQSAHRSIVSLAVLDAAGQEVARGRNSQPMQWSTLLARAAPARRAVVMVDPALRDNAVLLAAPAGARGTLVASIDLAETRAFRHLPPGTRFTLLPTDPSALAAARRAPPPEDAVTTTLELTLTGALEGLSLPIRISRRVPALGPAVAATGWRWAGVLALLSLVVGALAFWIALRQMRPMARARRDLERRVEQRTREMEALRDRQAGILGAISDVVYSVTPDLRRILYVNRAGEEATGLPAELLASVPGLWLDHVHERDRDGLLEAIARACAEGAASHSYRIGDEAGVLRHFQDRFIAVRGEDGKVERIDGVATDVTARVYADEAREMAEAMLRLKDRALESSSNGISISDMRLPDQPLVYVNHGFEAMTGFGANEVYGRNCRFLQAEDRGQPAIAELARAIAAAQPCTVVLRNYRKDGSLFWNELSVSPVLDTEGLLTHYVGVQTDITARRLAEARAEERARRLDTIFALSPDGFVSFDGDGLVAHVNPAFTRMTGLAPAAVLRRSREAFDALFQRIADPAQPCPPVAANDAAARQCTLTIVSPERRVLVRSARGAAEAEGGMVLYFRDITRETEVDRMKSEFLSTAAHELRTPMASIRGFSELLLRRDYDEPTRRDLLETIQRQSVRLTGLLNELLDLARIEARAGKDFRLRVQSLGAIVEDTLAALMVQGDSRKVAVRMPAEPVLVNADADKLQQALTNVLSNAYKYSPDGGAIELDLTATGGAKPEAVLAVRDHGIGLTPEQLARCFERFFRADTSGRIPGTGLGLALVKEIVELHGGRAEISSTFGEGTCVTLRLPLARAAPAASAA